jgi:hypothetical protein
MSTSGSVDFVATRDQTIQEALENLKVMQPGDTTSSTSFTDHSAGLAKLLNGLVKQYAYPTDGSPGMQVYHLKRAFLFLQKGEGVYTLGPTATDTGSTNKWASSYVATTISADEAAGQTVLTVVDNGTISSTNRIGIELDTGYVQWTTVSGAPTDNGATIDVTIAAALTSAASAGNRVYVYATTAQARRPLEIVHLMVRDVNNSDRLLHPMQLGAYEAISMKLQEGTITNYYYEQSLVDGTLFFNCEANSVRDVVRGVFRSPPEDLDAAANDLDFDQVWIRPLGWALTLEACGRFGQEGRAAYFKSMRDESLAIARNANPETSDLYFQPGDSE